MSFEGGFYALFFKKHIKCNYEWDWQVDIVVA